MTAQATEILLHSGEELALACEPLEVLFRLTGRRPHLQIHSTACWRGYVGTWAIASERLYLVGIRGHLDDGRVAMVRDMFPGATDRLFAHWYSGELRCPRGKLLEYVHGGFGSTYERDLLMDVERGVVKKISERINGKAEDGDAPDGYQVGAWTTFRAGVDQAGADAGENGSKAERT